MGIYFVPTPLSPAQCERAVRRPRWECACVNLNRGEILLWGPACASQWWQHYVASGVWKHCFLSLGQSPPPRR